MAYKRHGLKYSPSDVRPFTAGAAISDKYGVYLSAEDTIQHNGLANRRCIGIAMDSYDSGHKSCNVLIRGRYDAIADAAIAVGDPLTQGGTAGYFRKALTGETIYGYALKAASAQGDRFLGEWDFAAAQFTDTVVYLNTAVTADISPTLNNVAGTYAVYANILETAGNAITGGLDIGTAANGNEIATTLTVAGSTAYYYLPADMTAVEITLTENDEIFIEAETAWNSASINLKLTFVRIR